MVVISVAGSLVMAWQLLTNAPGWSQEFRTVLLMVGVLSAFFWMYDLELHHR